MLKKMLTVWGGMVSSISGPVWGLSDEHRHFLNIGFQCPNCDARLLNALGNYTANFYSADGRRLPLWSTFRADNVECPKCGHRWKMYGGSSVTPPSEIEVLEIIETERSEEFYGEDRRVVDNSKSSTQLTRNFSISKEWTKSCHLEMERAQSDGSELTIGAKEMPGLKFSSEEKLRQTYSVSGEAKETCTEEVSCQVLPHTKLTIAVRWKRIWQHGFVTATQGGAPFHIPFRVAVGMTFDQQQIDKEDDERAGA